MRSNFGAITFSFFKFLVILILKFFEKVSKLKKFRISISNSAFDKFYFTIHKFKNHSINCATITLLYSIISIYLEFSENIKNLYS